MFELEIRRSAAGPAVLRDDLHVASGPWSDDEINTTVDVYSRC